MSKSTKTRRPYARAANDAPTRMKRALWRWAEEQDQLKLGPKALLNHLADHADDEARVFIVGRHFRKLMNVSPRSLTNYIRKLEAEGLMVDVGDRVVIPSAQLAVYRLAPGDAAIALLLTGAAPDAERFSTPDTGSSTTDNRPGNICSTYKDNSKNSNLNQEAAGPGNGEAVPRDFGKLVPLATTLDDEIIVDFRAQFGEGAFRQYLKPALWSAERKMIVPRDAHAERWLLERAEAYFLDWGVDIASPVSAVARG